MIYFFLFFSPAVGFTEEGDGDYVIVMPEVPPADAYEVVADLFWGSVPKDDASGGWVEGCILQLNPIEYPTDWSVPTDEDGILKVIDFDGITFLPLGEIIGGIDPKTCALRQFAGV